MLKTKCIIGTREKDLLTKGEIYEVEEMYEGSKYYRVTCNDGIKRYFKQNRFEAVYGY
ncbi:hypothetical protein P5F12_13520 [Clostridium perfringens]|nr:hypothetical protein [Clostridium perfringens]